MATAPHPQPPARPPVQDAPRRPPATGGTAGLRLPQGGRGAAADAPVTLAPVTLAAVIGAHGVAGEVRLKVFADDLAAFKSFNGGSLTLKSLRPGNNGAIARFAEIADRAAAEAMRGAELTVPRAALPPLSDGEYYHADLIGLPVETPERASVGRVVLVENFGAGDVLEIERPDGRRFMVPMRPEAVPEWDAVRLVVATAFTD